MGHPLEKMKRVKLGPLDIESVPEGQYRRLEPAEVAKLSRAIESAIENKPVTLPEPKKVMRAPGRRPKKPPQRKP
jgi:hypothetical protein